MTTLRIAIDWRPALLERPAGIGRSVAALLEGLAEIRCRHEILLYAERPPPAPPPIGSVRTPPFTPGPGPLGRLAWHAWSLLDLERSGIDVWLATNSLVVPFARPGRAVPIVHDLSAFHHGWTHRWKVRAIHHVAFRRALVSAPRVVANSVATRDDLLAHLPLDPARIVVAPLGVASPFLSPADPETSRERREALGLPGRYLLAVGTLEPRKNLPGLLRALALLAARWPACPPLVLVGQTGWGGEDLDAIATGLGIQGRVQRAGFLSDADLRAAYAGAAALAMPSFHEGFGLPVVEAMASGVPIVTSPCGSLPEVAGDAAVYADPRSPDAIAEALERVLREPGHAETLASAGRRRAPLFTWGRFAARVLEAVEAAAAERGDARLPPAGPGQPSRSEPSRVSRTA